MRAIKALILLMSIISVAQSRAMGFSDEQLANPTNEKFSNPPAPAAADNKLTSAREFELVTQNLKLRIEQLNLRRQLLQELSATLKLSVVSPSDPRVESYKQELAAYWNAFLATHKTLDNLSSSVSRWHRELDGEHRNAYTAFSLILPKDPQETTKLLEQQQTQRTRPFIGPPAD